MLGGHDNRYATVADARSVGLYWAELRSSPTWVERRVETTDILDESHVEVSVSLTLDIGDLQERVTRHDFGDKSSAPIPLVALRKELQLDLDVRGIDGRAIPVVVSDEDSFYSHAFLLAEMERLGVDTNSFSDRVLEQTHSIVRRPDGVDVLIELIDAIQRYEEGSDADIIRLGIPESDVSSWNGVLGNKAAFSLLFELAEGYFLVVRIPLTSDSRIVKYRRLASANLYNSRFGAMPLGLKPLSFALNANGIGTAQREHTRVVAPPGTGIVGGEFLSGGHSNPVERRADPRRMVFYTSGYRPGRHVLQLDLRPRLASFFVPAFICCVMLSVFTVSALFLELADKRFSESADVTAKAANIDATVAILVLVPTLFAIFLVQRGEHGLVARLHAVPRAILLVPVFFVILAAGGVAAAVSSQALAMLLWFAVIFSVTAMLYFLAVLVSAVIYRLREPWAAFLEEWNSPRDA